MTIVDPVGDHETPPGHRSFVSVGEPEGDSFPAMGDEDALSLEEVLVLTERVESDARRLLGELLDRAGAWAETHGEVEALRAAVAALVEASRERAARA